MPQLYRTRALNQKIHPGLRKVLFCTKLYERNIASNEFLVLHLPRYTYQMYVIGNGTYETLNLTLLQQTIGRVESRPSANYVNAALDYHPVTTRSLQSLLKLCTICCQMRTTVSNFV